MPLNHIDTRVLREQMLSFLQTSFETFYEHTIAVDRQGIITWISDSYWHFLGCSKAPIGLHITEVIPNSYMPQVLASGEAVLLDLLYVHNQWVLVSVIPLHNSAGEVEGAFGFVATESPAGMKPLLAKYNHLQSELRNANRYKGDRSARYQLSHIAGQSEALRAVKQQIRQAARFDISVLLTGETGTGKELFAHALHELSDRADKPFVSINVAAIPDTLIEAEFFGVAPGAFTGAKKEGRPGKLEIARDGTLFLDEIGDMPLALQSKLLRVLQEREYERVGSNEVQTTAVRLVAATSRDLMQMVEQGEFRADLYYRLSAMPIQLPPLRERLEDMEALSERILDDCCARLGLSAKELTPEAINLLCNHSWPGNVRELYNVLERACILHENQSRIDAQQLSTLFHTHRSGASAPHTSQPSAAVSPTPAPLAPDNLDLKTRLRQAEQQTIREALQQCNGNRTAAAKLLGISRAALYQKLDRQGPNSDR